MSAPTGIPENRLKKRGATVADPAPAAFDSRRAAAQLLGEPRILKGSRPTAFQVHIAIKEGLPSVSVSRLESSVTVLDPAAVRRAIGLSVRTIQRRKKVPAKALSAEQSGRAWKFAEVLAKATDVLGTQQAAEAWLDSPAIALDGEKPIDMLATPVGTEMVERLLNRIEHGVYT